MAYTRSIGWLIVSATLFAAASLHFWDKADRADSETAFLLADTNHDGSIDSRDETKRAAAIVLVNCDDDDGDRVPDCDNGVVDGAEDEADLARIRIRRLENAAGLKARLKLGYPRAHEKPFFTGFEPHRRVRLFLPGPSGAEILGPTAGATADLPMGVMAGRGWVDLGVEGLEFGAAVTVELEIRRAGELVSRDSVEIRCAPFIALSNMERVEEILLSIADEGGLKNTYDFADSFDRADGVWTRKLDVIFPEESAYDDAWTQDQWEIGWQSAPGPDGEARGMRVFLELPRNGALKRASMREMIRPDVGVWERIHERLAREAAASESLNFGGNFECTGPAAGHPMGRILVGDNLNGGVQKPVSRELVDFFRAQRLQEPLVIDTGWLTVGHVDQVLAVLPDGRVTIASPREAIRALERFNGSSSARIMKGQRGWEMEVGDFLRDARGIRSLNDTLQPRLDAIAAQVERELRQKPIEIPALFVKTKKGGVSPWFPALQNYQVVNGRILAPDPMGPRAGGVDAFKAAFERALPGLPISYLDGCFVLHRQKGSVHCASNRLARPREQMEYWWRLAPSS